MARRLADNVRVGVETDERATAIRRFWFAIGPVFNHRKYCIVYRIYVNFLKFCFELQFESLIAASDNEGSGTV